MAHYPVEEGRGVYHWPHLFLSYNKPILRIPFTIKIP